MLKRVSKTGSLNNAIQEISLVQPSWVRAIMPCYTNMVSVRVMFEGVLTFSHLKVLIKIMYKYKHKT